jgi:hypothetical protein
LGTAARGFRVLGSGGKLTGNPERIIDTSLSCKTGEFYQAVSYLDSERRRVPWRIDRSGSPSYSAALLVFHARQGQHRPRSNSARPSLVIDPDPLLRVFGHARHVQHAAHESGPRLLGDWLEMGEIPELALAHLDLRHVIVEHPVAERHQSRLFGIGEHLFRQFHSHGRHSFGCAEYAILLDRHVATLEDGK